ncbi:hypothetical protein ILUMI_06533 [Ignelater luminosus]|uniref:Pre-rRNA-processing protein Ipi1 N-terminal domain-containing protein n=1 Tax=Ignelater luminosus TaxID=2038154 RepID=A0A8K0GHN0_IGNLU|nr:hypothetical protein ILUMI_06533 [Ignelater luminosus]
MGKLQRHKKVLRSEKAKVKLKAKSPKTKFLPKGANVTDVNFKVKPIVIREQLKINDNADESLTRRKLSYKDLLSRLNHHNLSSKCEALLGLNELINESSSAFVEQHLCELLHGVCKLLLDIESKAREKARKSLADILKNVSAPEKLSPFFHILTSYVTCAMTHIKRNVQEDSILVLDAYLEHAPMLIFKYFDKLFDSFLSLISKLRTDSKLSRTISDNLNSKLTSIKWRIKVLRRLQLLLKIYIDENNRFTEQKKSNCVIVHESQVNCHIPISTGLEIYPLGVLNSSSIKEIDSNDKLTYAEILIPLLYETWAEVAPLISTGSRQNGATILQLEAASVLSCITNIYYLLWKLTKLQTNKNNKEVIRVFLLKNHQRFMSHLLNQYPYYQHGNRKQAITKDMKLLELNMDAKCVNENLLIAYMFAVLYRTFPSQFYITKAQEILNYLEICLINRSYVPNKSIQILISVLRVIFFENSKNWSGKNIGVTGLLDNVVHFHDHLPIENPGKIQTFNLLCDIIQLQHVRSKAYEKWLYSLPLLLCKSKISAHMVDTLSDLTRQINRQFLYSFKEKLPSVLDNLTAIEITDKEDDLYPHHLKIVNMFRYLPLDEEDLQLLLRFVRTNKGSVVANYVREIL